MRRNRPLPRRAALPLAFLFVFLILTLSPGRAAADHPASRGFLDLSDHTFADSGLATLDGDWAFYWGQLLTPEEAAAVPPSGYMPVPGGWNGAQVGGAALPADGYATYRLQVRVADPNRSYGLAIRYMGTAYRLWVDGRLVAANGTVGTTPETSQPELLPVTVHFTPQEPVVNLVVQVSNFDHRIGGVWNTIWFGPSDQVAAAGERALALSVLLIGAIVMMGLYHLVLYSLNRGERLYLWFAILCLALALRFSLQGAMALKQALPAMNYDLQLRLEYLTGYLSAWMMMHFLLTVFAIKRPDRVVRGLAVVWAALALFTLLGPVRHSSVAILGAELLLPVWLGWGIWLSIRNLRQNRRFGQPFLFGFVFFELAMLHDFLGYNGVHHGPRLIPFGQLGLILIQSWVLAYRYADTLREQTRMARENAELYHRAQAHLEEVQRTRRLLTAREDQLRREIAEVLHGRVQTKLLLAAHSLEQAERVWESDPAQSRAQFCTALEQIDQVREEEIRQASHALHPSVIRVGLLPALRSLIAGLAGRLQVGLTIDPQVAALDDSLRQVLTEPQRLALYRAVEEALANVLAHAGTERATVALDLAAPGWLRLRVTDEGVGFAADEVRDGLGLRSVVARVEGLGGTWQLESNGGQGTAFTVTLPVACHSPELPVT